MVRSLLIMAFVVGLISAGCGGGLPGPIKVDATPTPTLAQQILQIAETGEVGDLGDEIAKLEPTNPAKAKELMADYVQLKRLSEDSAAVKAFAKKMAAKIP